MVASYNEMDISYIDIPDNARLLIQVLVEEIPTVPARTGKVLSPFWVKLNGRGVCYLSWS